MRARNNLHTVALIALAFLAIPFSALANDAGTTVTGSGTANFSDTYSFQRQGIFGCSLNGSYSMSVGAMSAIGGQYVPVNDAAVTLNTGYLVYKECVLRGVVDREREAATSAYVKQATVAALTGRNGGPMWPTDYIKDRIDRSDYAALQALQNGTFDTLNPALKDQVVRSLARYYMSATRSGNKMLTCPYQGDLNAVIRGQGSFNVWGGLFTETNPACNPLHAYELSRDEMISAIDLELDEMRFRLETGQGLYGVETVGPDGRRNTLTPANFVSANIVQALQSGFKQLESANDIDQMVGALFAGISSHIIADSRGLAGLLQSNGGRPSYLDQVAAESASGLRGAAANAALQILAAAKQIETSYLNAVNGVANSLKQAIAQLRGAENKCWELITPKAQEYAVSNGFNIKVATSSVASQTIIDAQIAPLVTPTANNINVSTNAMRMIDQLISGLTNTASVNAQRIALQELDGLVAQRKLHTQQDVTTVKKQQEDVQAAMTTLLQDTIKAWGDSTDPTVGWCNVNNQDVVRLWAERWRI